MTALITNKRLIDTMMALVDQLYIAGRISRDEYHERMHRLHQMKNTGKEMLSAPTASRSKRKHRPGKEKGK